MIPETLIASVTVIVVASLWFAGKWVAKPDAVFVARRKVLERERAYWVAESSRSKSFEALPYKRIKEADEALLALADEEAKARAGSEKGR